MVARSGWPPSPHAIRAALKATEQPIDTSTAAGKCFLDMLGVFAEFETNLRRERQLEGIAKASPVGTFTRPSGGTTSGCSMAACRSIPADPSVW